MFRKDFDSIFESLTDRFGNDAYNAAARDLVWEVVKDIAASSFESAVIKFCNESRHAPTAGDFRSACGKSIRQAEKIRRDKKIAEAALCRFCGKTGVAFAVLREHPRYEFQFQCICELGKLRAKDLPPWHDDRKEKYFLCSTTTAGIERQQLLQKLDRAGQPIPPELWEQV